MNLEVYVMADSWEMYSKYLEDLKNSQLDTYEPTFIKSPLDIDWDRISNDCVAIEIWDIRLETQYLTSQEHKALVEGRPFNIMS